MSHRSPNDVGNDLNKKNLEEEKSSPKHLAGYSTTSSVFALNSYCEIDIIEKNIPFNEKLAVAKVAPIAIAKNSRSIDINNGMQIVANPFIESYYPFLKESYSDEYHKTSSKSNIISKEKKLIATKQRTDEDEEAPKSGINEDKENNPISTKSYSKIRKYLRQQIIENFTSKKEEKNFVKEIIIKEKDGKLEEDQLHLHHHEHHHHYYLDRKKLVEGKLPGPRMIDDTVPASTSTKPVKAEVKNKVFDKVKSMPASELSEPPLLRASSYIASSADFAKLDCFVRTYNCDNNSNESGYMLTTRLRPSTSIDSVLLSKRSDLITTHTYSDTELSKYDSEDTNYADTFSLNPNYLALLSAKDSNNSGTKNNSDYNKLVESLKKLDGIMKPKIMSDSKNGSTISYIRCECMTTENISQLKESNRCIKVLKDSNILPFCAVGEEHKTDDKRITLKVWSDEMKNELEEIKKQLHKLEERHNSKRSRKSLTSVLREGKPKQESPNGHGISVYSSKTYIFEAENCYLPKGLRSPKLGEKNLESLFESSKFSPAEKDVSRLSSTPSYRMEGVWKRLEQQNETSTKTDQVVDNINSQKNERVRLNQEQTSSTRVLASYQQSMLH